MWTKPYGKTGKDITVVSFGGMRFPEPAETAKMADLVLYAHGKGINYFDTAPFYCNDQSEDIMGAAFAQMKRESFYCSTKCMESDGKELRTSLMRSLERLKVSKIDFFHIWCLVKDGDWNERKVGGAVAAVQRAKEEGLVGHVAASVHLSGAQTAAALADGVLEGVTLPYNALNFPFRQEALEAAAKQNLGVVTMNPLGGGVIPNHAASLPFLRGPNDRDAVEAAIRFNISQDAVTTALVGFSSNKHVDQAVAAVEGFKPYPPEHIEQVKRNVQAGFNGFCTTCAYCLPCPAGVPIPQLMESYNYHILGQGEKGVADRLYWHWELTTADAKACTGCGQCEERCTQHLPIRQRMEHVAKIEMPKRD
jgi:uncharacterized protein